MSNYADLIELQMAGKTPEIITVPEIAGNEPKKKQGSGIFLLLLGITISASYLVYILRMQAKPSEEKSEYDSI